MPPVPADTPPRLSTRAARSLLLGACALGLSGLALTSGSPAPATPSVASASTASPVALDLVPEPLAPHAAAPLPAAPTRAPRASRSRRVAPAKKKAAEPTGRWVRPSGAGIVSFFGPRWGRLHKGLDFGARYGAPLYAVGDGTVVGAGYQSGESGYGQITIIRHADGYYSAYAHQSSYLVRPGDHVTAGQLIGYVGATGEVTGPHLHFEIRTAEHGGQINPLPWLRSHGVDV